MTVNMKLMPLGRNDRCCVCGVAISAGTEAWWDKAAKNVTCLDCRPADTVDALEAPIVDAPSLPSSAPAAQSLPPPAPIDHGEGGVSAAMEYERRRARDEARIEEKWGTGRLGRFVKFISDEPQSTTAWAKGADGERRLARRLNDELADVAVVFHDRKVPGTRGNIDHLVIGPTGVWIVDAKNYKGKVEQRDVGGLFRTDRQLFVGGRNQMKLVEGLGWQIEAVRTALSTIGFAEAPLHSALCFTDAEWGLFSKPIRLHDAHVLWPSALIERAKASGPFDGQTIDTVARHLSSALPASR